MTINGFPVLETIGRLVVAAVLLFYGIKLWRRIWPGIAAVMVNDFEVHEGDVKVTFVLWLLAAVVAVALALAIGFVVETYQLPA